MSENCPKCDCCEEKPAVCFGRTDEFSGFACDDCCGHGGEDCECWRLCDVPELLAQLAAETKRADDAEAERDELKTAVWCLDEPDDATHQDTLNMIDSLWSKRVSPVLSLLDQSRALAAAEARATGLAEKLDGMKQSYLSAVEERVSAEKTLDRLLAALLPAGEEANDGDVS